jgi:hypothetical protein
MAAKDTPHSLKWLFLFGNYDITLIQFTKSRAASIVPL